MFEILTVCTGNICRSPLAAQLLQTRLAPYGAVVPSAGTRGLRAAPMTPESAHLAVHLGVPAELSAAHASRFLTEAHLDSPALIFAMTRDHRREIAELAPARLRSTFTIREFARLAQTAPDDELRAAADAVGPDAAAKVRALGATLASYRGLAAPPDDPADDDVIDPYRQPWEVYQRSAAQLVPAVDEVVRVIRLGLGAR